MFTGLEYHILTPTVNIGVFQSKKDWDMLVVREMWKDSVKAKESRLSDPILYGGKGEKS